MNLFFKCCFIFIFLFCLNESKAQENFVPGYVITNNNDTLKGYIDYRGDTRNSKRCDFKPRPDSKSNEYLPGEIKAYRFKDSKNYISRKITLNNEDQSIFLEFLINGVADLYFFKDDNGADHYFIEKSDGKLIELTNMEEFIEKDGKTYTHERKEYIGLLKIAFEDCPQIYPAIDQTILDKKSLIDISKIYHNYLCDSAKCIIYEKLISKTKIKFAPFFSMNTSSLMIGNLDYVVDFQTTNYVLAGILMNVSFPDLNEKITMQISEEIGPCYFSTKNLVTGKVDFHSIILKTKAGVKYSAPKGKIRPTVLAGGHFLALLIEKGANYLDRNKTKINLGANIDLGIDYYRSSSPIAFLSIGYTSSRGLASYDMIPWLKNINVNVGIYF